MEVKRSGRPLRRKFVFSLPSLLQMTANGCQMACKTWWSKRRIKPNAPRLRTQAGGGQFQWLGLIDDQANGQTSLNER